MSVAQAHVAVALHRARIECALALAEQNRAPEADLVRLRTKLAEATSMEEQSAQLAGPQLPLAQLSARLDLTPLAERVLIVFLALELDPLFSITVSALAGEEPRQGLSAKVLAQIFRFAGDEALELALSPEHPLVRAALLEAGGAPTYPDSLRPYRLAPRVGTYLAGSDELDQQLRRAGGIVEVSEDLVLDHAAAAEDLVDRVLDSDEETIVCIEGIDGVGRRTLVGAVAARHGREVVYLDIGRLSADKTKAQQELRALRRECWLRGAVPLIARIDTLGQTDPRRGELMAEIADALEGDGAVPGAAFITGYSGTELPETRRRVLRVRVDTPSSSTRRGIWIRALGLGPEGRLTGDDKQSEGQDVAETVQLYALTPGAIGRAAANARLIARGRVPTASELRAGVQAEIQERFGGIATRVDTTQRWDDLVLPQDTMDDIKAFAARAEHASMVYEAWGFRRKLQKGLGLAALFSGPPGTGKTMVAGLIAQHLGLEMYMVDLSQVVSKWVGETEKQLGKIFDAAQMGNVVLLFDEADALFAKRTEVKSSNDRYANLEVNYLLTRLEQFGGVAILTTNLDASVDPAFKRRLAADVRFYPPEQPERERLWASILPKEAPVEGTLDFRSLADRYKELAGGHIRNAVLRAAFLAAVEKRAIDQSLLERAATSEYRAMGKVL